MKENISVISVISFSVGDLYRHKYGNVVTFHCQKCSKTFSRKDNLHRHTITCKGKCETTSVICGYNFNKAFNLKRTHMKNNSLL